MVDTLKLLRAQGCDVYYITNYLTGLYGGPKEFDVVLRKMQEIYFWERMGVKMGA